MARRKKHEEHENHERWLVSYADFITLLFAFFVVMYSISSVNEGKYRVLSNSIVTAFSSPAKSLKPIQQGTPIKAPVIQQHSMNQEDVVPRVGVDLPTSKEMSDMEKLSDQVLHNLKDLVDADLLKVYKTDKGLEIEIKSSILFRSGQAELEPYASSTLGKIAKLIKDVPNKINVEGYTDNIPIKTPVFPSNWELSAARAASVVQLFGSRGVDPERMAAVGHGQYQPVAENTTAEGRAKNRRVTIMVLKESIDRRKRLEGLTEVQQPGNSISRSISNAIYQNIAIEPIMPGANVQEESPAGDGREERDTASPKEMDTIKSEPKPQVLGGDESTPKLLGASKPISLPAAPAEGAQ